MRSRNCVELIFTKADIPDVSHLRKCMKSWTKPVKKRAKPRNGLVIKEIINMYITVQYSCDFWVQ